MLLPVKPPIKVSITDRLEDFQLIKVVTHEDFLARVQFILLFYLLPWATLKSQHPKICNVKNKPWRVYIIDFKYFLTRGVFMCKVIYIFAKSTVFSVGEII